jgi:4,5-DOPA dioxygenase extradiol
MQPLMPAIFVGHGSPMNALETNRYTEAWRLFGETVPRPRAILVVSAHWFVNLTAVTAMPQPRTIHDFFGFPKPLFEVTYPAPGDPQLAQEIADLVKPRWLGLDHDGWGLDHGTWSVLKHAFPAADVPVLQLSINATKAPEFHVEVGAQLAPLRERGVLIVASGNIVHNLRALDWQQKDLGFDWAKRFDDAARAVLTAEPEKALELLGHSDYGRAAPTPEHFYPLLYLAGLAQAAKRPAQVLIQGYAFGSISMTAYTLDADCPHISPDSRPAANLPDPALASPENSNV